MNHGCRLFTSSCDQLRAESVLPHGDASCAGGRLAARTCDGQRPSLPYIKHFAVRDLEKIGRESLGPYAIAKLTANRQFGKTAQAEDS
mmetsp:Transcript_41092/g.108787  ORF Transcript_41092/g.108787 Transcript_41092/m.108787 type:complete len:88 (+) Transcript_41092:987-1250(+)